MVLATYSIMEREKHLSIFYQKTRSGNPFSSKATCDKRLPKENDNLQCLFSSNLALARVQISLFRYSNINADRFRFTWIPITVIGLLLASRCASFRAHSGISCIGYPIGNIFSGTDNVQAAQKFITGLDATRLSKFPEYR
ncbi:hypothetical protein NC653_038235 [Populus alba x Populus x berolinensis]|uniref:Uncharacterized protein n=1 Tax=Populus alba x Populus x berolinensis TaxID=444605 RepID=A0AAD6PSY6_9ROSI|nr:hypothetical protein NC653_038235 [Populus alba x Populus x berolinensis]